MGVGVNAMIRSVASRPSILGMWMSIVTRSGRRRATRSTASSPLVAVPTTSIAGSLTRMCVSISLATMESSAMTTRIRCPCAVPGTCSPCV